jgi:hypothetical protein
MKIHSKIFLKLRYRLPKFTFGVEFSEALLDHIAPFVYFDKWMIQPFNGQAVRWNTISAISRKFEPTTAVETGTFLGSSTPYISSLVSGKTYSIEINVESFNKTTRRFRENHSERNIELILGDSAQKIREVLAELDPESIRVIAYLDAHWLDAIPTADELLALVEWGGAWIAIIDDFMVPHDDGYGFDHYGETTIGADIVPLNCGISIFVPRGPSSQETNAKRGTGYLFNEQSKRIVQPDDFRDLARITQS